MSTKPKHTCYFCGKLTVTGTTVTGDRHACSTCISLLFTTCSSCLKIISLKAKKDFFSNFTEIRGNNRRGRSARNKETIKDLKFNANSTTLCPTCSTKPITHTCSSCKKPFLKTTLIKSSGRYICPLCNFVAINTIPTNPPTPPVREIKAKHFAKYAKPLVQSQNETSTKKEPS